MQKIMFNDRYGLTQAVIEGRKTVTRRLVPQELIDSWDEFISDAPSVGGVYVHESEIDFYSRMAPRFKLGEVVAVAQSYEQVYLQGGMSGDDAIILGLKYDPGMSNKMYVRSYLMPHRIRITGVRCEQLQDISDADCLREGVRYIPKINKFYFEDVHREEGFYFDDHREAFSALIDKVSGRGTWERNPWVVVYEFELVR